MADKRSAQNRSDDDKLARSTGEAESQVQDAVDEETEQGFRGVEVDTTPNHAYTVAGVVAGEPVPEAAADPVAARREASS